MIINKVWEDIQDFQTHRARRKSLRISTLYACSFLDWIWRSAFMCSLYTGLYIFTWNLIWRWTPSRHSSRAWCIYRHLSVEKHYQIYNIRHTPVAASATIEAVSLRVSLSSSLNRLGYSSVIGVGGAKKTVRSTSITTWCSYGLDLS